MIGFYIGLIFIGCFLIVLSLVWIVYDKKKSFDYESQIEMRKNELSSIINDAEAMIDEMNKFSDYVINRMERKSLEITKNLDDIEAKIEGLEKAASAINTKEVGGEDLLYKAKNNNVNKKSPGVSESMIDIAAAEDYNTILDYSTRLFKEDSKAMPLSDKHREVIELSKKGMKDTDIAKSLKIGKGEVQLILGINR